MATRSIHPSQPCSDAVIAKGMRLAASSHHRVTPIVETYVVDGEHGRYTVTVSAGSTPACTCPATVPVCSHIVAVAAHRRLHAA